MFGTKWTRATLRSCCSYVSLRILKIQVSPRGGNFIIGLEYSYFFLLIISLSLWKLFPMQFIINKRYNYDFQHFVAHFVSTNIHAFSVF